MNLRKALSSRSTLSCVGLSVIFCLGTGYLLLGALQINPVASTYSVTVQVPTTGGLQVGSDVTLRGSRVGTMSTITLDPDRVLLSATIDTRIRISANTDVVVTALSAAGEQYLDFRPHTDQGPFLSDGEVIGMDSVRTPTPFSTLLSHVSGVANQIDPAQLDTIIAEMDRASAGGPNQLKTLIDSASVLAAGLNSVLPETLLLIRAGRETLRVASDITPDLAELSRGGSLLAQQLAGADNEIRTLLGESPALLDNSRRVIGDSRSSGGDLLKNLGRIAQAARLRAPALQALFPALRDFGEALSVVGHDGALNILAEPYPRKTCEYTNPVQDPSIANTPAPLLYMYCNTDDPALQVRGAASAPRPEGDSTAGPPPGVSGAERARPGG